MEANAVHGGDVTLRVAAVQAAPVVLDCEATLDKVEALTRDAVAEGAKLVVFGELFLPGYPIWALVQRPVDLHRFFERYVQNAVEVPGPECARIGEIAARYGTALSIGVSERSSTSLGTLWNSNLIFGANGVLVQHRRKLVGTYTERLVFAPGDAAGLHPIMVGGARVGTLICGENTNTLARFALLAEGENVHIATYPPCGVFERDPAAFDMADAVRIRAAAHSFEGKVFTIAVATMPDHDAIEQAAAGDTEALGLLNNVPPSASMIIGPRGEMRAGPLVGEEGILVADLDLESCVAPKLMHDIVGAYNRFDIFHLSVDESRVPGVEVRNSKQLPNEGRDAWELHTGVIGPSAPVPRLEAMTGQSEIPRRSWE